MDFCKQIHAEDRKIADSIHVDVCKAIFRRLNKFQKCGVGGAGEIIICIIIINLRIVIHVPSVNVASYIM